jgi:hypothetical protein
MSDCITNLRVCIAHLAEEYSNSMDELVAIQQKVSNLQTHLMRCAFSYNQELELMLRELLEKETCAKRTFDFYSNNLAQCQNELTKLLLDSCRKKRKHDEI